MPANNTVVNVSVPDDSTYLKLLPVPVDVEGNPAPAVPMSWQASLGSPSIGDIVYPGGSDASNAKQATINISHALGTGSVTATNPITGDSVTYNITVTEGAETGIAGNFTIS